MKKVICLFFLMMCSGLFLNSPISFAKQDYIVVVELVKDGERELFSYEKGQFHYQKGEETLTGTKAKEKVEMMLQTLHIHKEQTVVSMITSLKKAGYEVERLDVRFTNEDGKLYTWVWKK
ncbi:MAG TPA: hypothetical protein VLA13_00905 [Massilibacterium sp.]|nr:hypothetical protein [Massilibacterium sp.]